MDKKGSILIIDDDSTTGTLSPIFREKGYDTAIATTGREAIKKVKRRFFNLALLDLKLPDMKGMSLIAPLNRIHPDMAVIMITAPTSLKTTIQALNEGARLILPSHLKRTRF